MSAKTAHVDGGLTPLAACLWRVISAVFIHVQKPWGALSNSLRMPWATFSLTHSSICLDNTASHTTDQTSSGRVDTHGGRSRLDFRSSEEEHSTLRRRLYPCLAKESIGKQDRTAEYVPME